MSTTEEKDLEREQAEITLPNPFEIWKKMYFAAEDAVAASVRDSIKTRSFAVMIDSMLDAYLLNHKMITEINQKYLEKSPFPSKADVARVAELVISMEDKIDNIETMFITQLSRIVQAISTISDRVNQLDNQTASRQFNKLAIAVDKSTAQNKALSERVENLEQSVARLEQSLNELKSMLNEALIKKSQ